MLYEKFFKVYTENDSNHGQSIKVGVLSDQDLKAPYPLDIHGPGVISDGYPDIYIVFAYENPDLDEKNIKYPQVVVNDLGFLLRIDSYGEFDTRLIGFNENDDVYRSYEYTFRPYYSVSMYVFYRDPSLDNHVLRKFINDISQNYWILHKIEIKENH